jgi:hypothetical protein
MDQIIADLKRPFPAEELRQRPGGNGMQLDYIDWPSAVHRLDNAIGTNNWSFVVSDLKMLGDDTAGYAICQGHMTITFPDGTTATKGGYGGCAYGQGGRGMSPDDAAKGAASDALKKSASLFGVGLHLTEKPATGQTSAPRQQQSYPARQQANNQSDGPMDLESLFCEECGEPLTETRFKDGTNWAPTQLAVFGRRKHSRILCMTDYRAANDAKRRAEEALQSVPF